MSDGPRRDTAPSDSRRLIRLEEQATRLQTTLDGVSASLETLAKLLTRHDPGDAASERREMRERIHSLELYRAKAEGKGLLLSSLITFATAALGTLVAFLTVLATRGSP